MADAVTSQTLLDGERLAIMKFTDVSDGVGESGVLKVDVSALAPNANGQACTGVMLAKAESAINAMSVNVQWDATADVTAFVLAPGVQTLRFDPPIPNNAGAGVTGDVLFTTIGAAANSTYSIILTMVKVYG